MRSKLQMQKWRSRISIICTVALLLSGTTLPVNTVASEEPETQKNEYSCSFELHKHTEDCYDADRNIICGYADYAVHTHDSNCYDSDGNLICELEEVKVHVHDDNCYKTVEVPAAASAQTKETATEETQKGHTHTEDCYEEVRTLICDKEETAGHTHTDDCYTDQLICGQEETEGHTHDADCYDADENLICGQEETEGHTHTAACYNRELTCGKEETAGHTHDSSCYTVEKKLICGQEETAQPAASAQTESQKETEVTKELICTKPEVQLHKHTNSCYDADGTLTCGKLEVLEHQHTEACFSTAQTDPVSEEETETEETETETEEIKSEISQEEIDQLCDDIIEAMKTDEDLLMDLYAATEDLEKQKSLADRFEVEPEVMLTLFEQIQDVTDAITNYMDEADDGGSELDEQLQKTVDDSELLQELAERFDTTPSVLLLTVCMAYGIQPYGDDDDSEDMSQYYVGVCDGKIRALSQLGSPEWALGVVPYNDYTAEDATRASRAQNLQIAYCYNLYKKFPGNMMDGRYLIDSGTTYRDDALCLYKIVENATATDFDTYAAGNTLTGADLRHKILNVALKGYPHNYLGLFTGQGGMTEEQFRLMTQYAIWYYTDGWMPNLSATGRYSDEEKNLYYALINDNSYNRLSAYSDYCKLVGAAYSPSNEISDETLESLGAYVNLYDSQDVAYTDDTREYQNLLVVGKRSDALTTYEPKSYRLSLTKKIETIEEDDFLLTNGYIYKTFDFHVTIWDENGDQYYDGTCSLSQADKPAVFSNLKEGYTYKITEAATDGYSATATSSLGDVGSLNSDGTYTIEGTIGGTNSDVVTVDFVNTENQSTYNLCLKKTVNGGNTDQEFSFTIKFYNNGNYLGETTTELTQNGTWKMTGIPAGWTYEVIETATEGYTASATSSRGDKGTLDGNNNCTITGTMEGSNEDITVNFVNTVDEPETYNLTLSKTVAIKEGVNATVDPNEEFKFTVKLIDASKKTKADGADNDADSYAPLTGSYDLTYSKIDADGTTVADLPTETTLTLDANGEGTITLKHGQKVTIEGLPDNYGYVVTEDANSTDFTKYTPTIYIDGEEQTSSGEGILNSVGMLGMTKNSVIAFTNTKLVPDSLNLTISKTVDIAEGVKNAAVDPDEEFTFTVNLVDASKKTVEDGEDNAISSYAPLTGSYTLTYSKIDATDKTVAAFPSQETLSLTNGTGTIKLKPGQQVKISGLPYRYGYVIAEDANSTDFTKYTPTIYIDDEKQTSSGEGILNSVGTFGMIADSTVAFTNTKKRPDSYELTLSKKVVTVNSTIDTDEDFTFTLKLYDSAGNALTKEFDVTYGTLSEIANAKTPGQTTGTLDFTSGTATVTLKHGQTITIKGLPYKYGYEVSETPAGYTPTVEVDGVQKLNTQGTTTLNTLKATGICKDTTVAYTNTKIEKKLTLKKTVEGQNADTNKAFQFDIELKAGETALTGKVQVTSSAITGVTAPDYTELEFDKDGKATVNLKHGQKITLEGLPYNYTCKITEDSTVAAGYTIKSLFDAGTQNTETTGTENASGATITVSGYADATVSYVNTKTNIVPTGIRLDIMPYIIVVAMVLGLAVLLLTRRRSRR